MSSSTVKVNFLVIALSCIFVLTLFAGIFESSAQTETNPTETETETETESTDGTANEGSSPETSFGTPPKFVSSVAAWKYAETKLYELSHWESIVRDQIVDPGISVAGQIGKYVKVWNGKQDCYKEYSTILAPGKIFGMEVFERVENKGGIITLRSTPNQTAEREPIWVNEGTKYTEYEYIALRGNLPLLPSYIITSATTINGSKRPISDGKKITFSLELRSSASVNYIKEIKNASGSTTTPIIEDGWVKFDVVLNAKTGLFISIKSIEKYNITVKGMNTTCTLTGTEYFSNYVI